ncbi:MAG: ATP-binding protein [Xanthomonadales bacterium]|nr:ATP-binding protein [Xanthomonadales bacterium]
MNLRQKLLLLALVALVLPLSSWLLLRELEGFLRAGQQQALQATASTIARSLDGKLQQVAAANANDLLVSAGGDTAIDGYFSYWPAASAYWNTYASDDGELQLKLAARSNGRQLWLALIVSDHSPVRENLAIQGAMDGFELNLFGQQGMTGFKIAAAATGPFTLNSNQHSQISGYWLDNFDGYQVELLVPLKMAVSGLSLRLVDVDDPGVRLISREINLKRLQLAQPQTEIAAQIKSLLGAGQSAWLLDNNDNIRARASGGDIQSASQQQSNWVQRVVHDLMSKQLPSSHSISGTAPRLPAEFEAVGWTRDASTAQLINAVSVPVSSAGQIVGSLQMQAVADDLLLLSNNALLRIVGISLLAMVIIMLAMYLFAGRLSARVRKLNQAVNRARERPHVDPDLPLLEDRDELGELARSDARLLQAVREYNQYLQTLASKLSHELKTPLVIVRSSLENLSRDPSDPKAAIYISRAQEGSDRLAGILRAMSDASRLEQSIAVADTEDFDLAALLTQSTAAYAQIYPQYQIECELDQSALHINGAPELLAQALDKLVDNAVSFSGPDDLITLGMRSSGPVEIFVRNTGSSLPDEMQDSLFESLVSLRTRSRDGVPHLGLGLYLVKLIAQAHHGKASARNLKDKQGVEFTLTLPKLAP